MPIPKPRKNETEKDFISRCMGDETMKREYPQKKGEKRAEQRLAVCYDSWRKAHGGKKPASALPTDWGNETCAAQHMGLWLVEPRWFSQAVQAVLAGTWAAQPVEKSRVYPILANGIAVIDIHGHMTKGESSLGGASTVRIRQVLRQAVNDDAVEAILLHVDSPGGTVAGTADLAQSVVRADAQKPVHAYIEDMGASAAYWVASQARTVAVNRTADIGSIGAFAIVEDLSGKYAREGIKVHVLRSGKFKGAFAPGAEISPEQLQMLQDRVDRYGGFITAGVAEGRSLSIEAVQALADGRLFGAADAMRKGLIDAIETLDETLERIQREPTGGNIPGARVLRARLEGTR